MVGIIGNVGEAELAGCVGGSRAVIAAHRVANFDSGVRDDCPGWVLDRTVYGTGIASRLRERRSGYEK